MALTSGNKARGLHLPHHPDSLDLGMSKGEDLSTPVRVQACQPVATETLEVIHLGQTQSLEQLKVLETIMAQCLKLSLNVRLEGKFLVDPGPRRQEIRLTGQNTGVGRVTILVALMMLGAATIQVVVIIWVKLTAVVILIAVAIVVTILAVAQVTMTLL